MASTPDLNENRSKMDPLPFSCSLRAWSLRDLKALSLSHTIFYQKFGNESSNRPELDMALVKKISKPCLFPLHLSNVT